MNPRTLLILALGAGFAALVAFALWREIAREEAVLAASLSGIVEVERTLYASGQADIVRTDRIALYLVDAATRKPMALNIITPLVPPQTITVGQEHAMDGATLSGAYLLVGITDKDGEIGKVTPGEVYGISPVPIPLGTEQVRLVLDQVYRGGLYNTDPAMAAAPPNPPVGGPIAPPPQSAPPSAGPMAGPMAGGAAGAAGPLGERPDDPALSIQGEVRVADAVAGGVASSDRLVILLFDPELGRPVANKIIPHTFLPQRFSISLPPGAPVNAARSYQLRILTDKNGSPFDPAPGEVIGRSAAPIPLGTTDVVFMLDTPYQR